jgi:hypothetical protein
MAGMSRRIRQRTDALDAAGNTHRGHWQGTYNRPVSEHCAIAAPKQMVLKFGLQGFAIGSAALVSLALFGAFVSRAGVTDVNVLNPKVFVGLLVGAMLPYWFSAMTMKSVGSAALRMVEEVRRQCATIPGLMEGRAAPDYARCVRISTNHRRLAQGDGAARRTRTARAAARRDILRRPHARRAARRRAGLRCAGTIIVLTRTEQFRCGIIRLIKLSLA